MLLSEMSLRKMKKLLRKKSSLPSWPDMKKMRILSPTTLRIVMKKYKQIAYQLQYKILKAKGEIQTTSARAK
jgi:hypothetical protein